MKNCPECGFEFPDEENFCPKCGKYFPSRMKYSEKAEEKPQGTEEKPKETSEEFIEKLLTKLPEKEEETAPSEEKGFKKAFSENLSANSSFEDLSTPSVWSFVLTFFLCSIPFVGFVYLIVLAFGGTKYRAKKNYARAIFLYAFLIAVAVSLMTIAMIFFHGNDMALFFAYISEMIKTL